LGGDADMVVVLDGIKNVGEEVQCGWCDSIIHFEYEDWFDVEYFAYDGTKRLNEAICCPKCGTLVYRWRN
jgi:hypothetical protein